MKLVEKIPKTGTTKGRKAFWDSCAGVVSGLQKQAGRNVSVSEHQGYGTIIDVTREQSTDNLTIWCPVDDTICVTFADIVTCVSCINITTGSYYLQVSAGSIDLNGSFDLTETFPGQWEGTGGNLHLQKFSDDLCTTMTDECDSPDFRIVLQCFGPEEPDPNTRSFNIIYELPGVDNCLASWPGARLEAFIGKYAGPFTLPSLDNSNQITTHCGNSGTGISIIKIFGDPEPPTATMSLTAGSCAP